MIQRDLLKRDARKQHVDVCNFRSEVLLEIRNLNGTKPRRFRPVGFQRGLPLNEPRLWARVCAGGIDRLPVGPGLVGNAGIAGPRGDFNQIFLFGSPGQLTPRRNRIRIFHSGFIRSRSCQRIADTEELSDIRRSSVQSISGLNQPRRLLFGRFQQQRRISGALHGIDAAFRAGRKQQLPVVRQNREHHFVAGAPQRVHHTIGQYFENRALRIGVGSGAPRLRARCRG